MAPGAVGYYLMRHEFPLIGERPALYRTKSKLLGARLNDGFPAASIILPLLQDVVLLPGVIVATSPLLP